MVLFLSLPSFSKLEKGEARVPQMEEDHCGGVHEGLLQTRADKSQGEHGGGLDTRRDETGLAQTGILEAKFEFFAGEGSSPKLV